MLTIVRWGREWIQSKSVPFGEEGQTCVKRGRFGDLLPGSHLHHNKSTKRVYSPSSYSYESFHNVILLSLTIIHSEQHKHTTNSNKRTRKQTNFDKRRQRTRSNTLLNKQTKPSAGYINHESIDVEERRAWANTQELDQNDSFSRNKQANKHESSPKVPKAPKTNKYRYESMVR